MTEATTISMVAINKWFYWCYNYTDGFIQKIWSNDPGLAKHLQGKFDGLYKSYGARAVMQQFYAELDGSNRLKLMEWVLANYNDECKLRFTEDD